MKKLFRNNILYIVGAALGAAIGYLYWQQVGCASGTCAITSSPVNSTLYGAVMGSLLLSLFKRGKVKHYPNNKENEV